MTVHKPAGSKYWHYDFVIDKVRYARSTHATDKATANKIEAEARRAALTPNKGRPAISLDQAAVLYAERAATQPSWPDTRRMLRTMLATIGGAKLLSEITQRDLMLAVARRRNGRANSSVNRELTTWRACWRYADAARFEVGDMPAWGKLALPVPNKVPRTLSADEERRLFAVLRPDLADFVRFTLASGWRMAEVIRLTWSDVDLGGRTARTRIKGGDTISRPLSAAMLALIASQPRVAVQVFTYEAQSSRTKHAAKDGRKRSQRVKGERYPLSENGWRKPWVAAVAAAGIDAMRFHDLRHTRGTRILAATGNLVLAQKALGHRTLTTTLRYAHALAEDVRNGLDASESHEFPMAVETASRKG